MQPFVGFLLLVGGVFSAAFPYAAWYGSIGWKIRDAEPSEAALAMNRVGGVVAVVIGLIVMVSSCSTGDDTNYSEYFQKRLVDEGYVQEIRVGFGPDARPLPKEQMDRAIDLMAHSKMTALDAGGGYSAMGEATIEYSDGTTDDLLLFGSYGGIDLLASGSSKVYRFESSELESLFRSWLNNR